MNNELEGTWEEADMPYSEVQSNPVKTTSVYTTPRLKRQIFRAVNHNIKLFG